MAVRRARVLGGRGGAPSVTPQLSPHLLPFTCGILQRQLNGWRRRRGFLSGRRRPEIDVYAPSLRPRPKPARRAGSVRWKPFTRGRPGGTRVHAGCGFASVGHISVVKSGRRGARRQPGDPARTWREGSVRVLGGVRGRMRSQGHRGLRVLPAAPEPAGRPSGRAVPALPLGLRVRRRHPGGSELPAR